MACVGWTYQECVARYGVDGSDSMHAPERGTDRADMERIERDDAAADLVSFVELRAATPTG